MSKSSDAPDEVTVTVTLHARAAKNLEVLGELAAVLERLADHAQQGVYRPGSWERPWLMQAFGDEWLARVEPDTGDLSMEGRVIFDRPRR